MKKYLYLIALGCLGMIRPIHAADTDISTLDNVIYVEPFAAKPGSTELVMSFQMKNSAQIRGFQFNLTLPDGVTPAKYGNGNAKCSLTDARRPEGDQHTLSAAEQTDGSYLFLCGSLQDEVFTGTSGEIATMLFNVDATMAEGAYPIVLTAMKLTETDISKSYETERIEATLTISKDVRTVLSETSTTVPEASNGAVDVKVERTIKANEWSTICLPFAMTEEQVKSDAVFGNDVQIAEFISYEVNDDKTEITVEFADADLTNDGFMANYPYIIKTTNEISEFIVDGVTIDPDEENAVAEYAEGRGARRHVYGTFIGTYHPQTVVPANCLFLSGNEFWYSTGQTKMKGFRAYFNFEDVLAGVGGANARVKMNFNEATGINTIDHSPLIIDHYYDLQGRSVESPVKGIYLKNGKKVVVK